MLERKWEEALAASAAEPRADRDGSVGAGQPGEPAAGDDGAAPPSEEVERLRREVASLQEQVLRQQAEMVNFRRRVERDRGERAESERAALLRELLPVVDDFERALAADDGGGRAYREGMELILRELHETFDRLGLQRFDPTGEPFDPHMHEAIEHLETDEVPHGHVVSVYQPGYRIGDRLVRAAMVAVARRPAQPGEAAAGAPVAER